MKVFLKVPYDERREAKALGAHWDPSEKRWYVLSRPEFIACKRWWPEITDEIRSWLNDLELTKYYGEAVSSTRNPPRQTSSYERDKIIRRIVSPKQKLRHQKHAKYHPHLRVGKLPQGKTLRFPADTNSGSSTLIRSITVKLPL